MLELCLFGEALTCISLSGQIEDFSRTTLICHQHESPKFFLKLFQPESLNLRITFELIHLLTGFSRGRPD